jgi:hypothetical protein
VTRAFHNGLQGRTVSIFSRATSDCTSMSSRENAERLDLGADVVFVHDPQPAFSRVSPDRARPAVDLALSRGRLPASRNVWKHLEDAMS